jgi:hypothetical protein
MTQASFTMATARSRLTSYPPHHGWLLTLRTMGWLLTLRTMAGCYPPHHGWLPPSGDIPSPHADDFARQNDSLVP